MGVGLRLRLLLVLLVGCWGLEQTAAAGADGAPQSTAAVGTAAQFLAALEDPNVATIAVVKPISMPHGRFKPAVVERQLLVTSPHREMIDWCNEQCRNGSMPRTPFIILGKGAMVTFNRLFFRNFIPHSSKALSAAALDFKHSPVPFIVSKDGGQAIYNLVVLHWTRPMLWVFKQPGSFWQQAAEEKVRSVGDPQPLQLETPALYSVKSFSTDAGTAAITDCFMPVDLDGCLSQQPFGTTLIYCPYTFKDSLRNPNVDTVLVFHDIGLDRLVNSYRNPAVVNRSVLYRSCPNTRHIMDLDNITNSVLVDSGGSLVMQNLILQGSKSQNKTDWPSSIPLLLSTFRPIGSGSMILRDSTVRVQSMDELIKAMSTLPNGAIHAVESPDLRPTYAGKPPRLGDASFTIRLWQLQRQRWLLNRAGGSTIMDKLGSTASWQFFNVTAEEYTQPDCFAAAVVQASVLPGRYSKVSTGQELLDQLGNSSARYIRLMNGVTLPPDLGMRLITVSRIVEIRSCTDGETHVINWAGNHDSVIVSGNAIWQGNMAFQGIGWSKESVAKKEIQIVDALHPTGTGIVEYEDLTLMADMPSNGWEPDAGKTSVAGLLGVSDLESSPLNMSTLGPGKLLLRGFYLNQSLPSGGNDGMESFQDVTLSWSLVPEDGSGGRGLSQGRLLVAIIIPIIVASVLAGTVLACLFCRAYHRRRAAAAAGGKDVDDFGTRSPFVNAIAHACMGGGKGGGKGGGGAGAVIVGDGTASSGLSEQSEGSVRGKLDQQASCTSGPSGTSAPSSSVSKSRDRTAFNADIAQACKVLVTRRGVGRDDELILESVLGEGSYGKVFKATWRGTVVAVKIMVLPAHLSGKEKREKMAVMETAISSSLSHPNCVQTYTYAVEPVRANSSMTDHSGDEGPSMHDSTCSWKGGSSGAGLARLAKEQFRDGSGSDMGTFSWEVRLVQEYCDLGSLRSAFKQNYFKSACGAVQEMPLVATAIDVARAMAHLHKHNIVHSDLKARNVLLRSDMQDPRGFTAKVADFGLSITIDPNSTHVSNAFQGTLTHMAPETLMHGHISPASDVFAYGILMWELYTGEHAYKGVPRALLGHNITKQGMRPVFPPDTPFEWQFLACRCWESDPGIRPSFHQILEELQRIQARWSASRSSTDESVAATSATQISSSMCSDSSPQLPQRPGLPLQQQQQQQQQQLGGYLPSIEDTSDPLPSSCAPQQQQQEWQPPAEGLGQQLHNGGPPAPCLAEQLNAPAGAQAAGAAAGGLGLGVAPLGPQGAATNSMPPPPQKQQQQHQQQQKPGLASPAVHMCFEGSSKDVLVLLSDCDTTYDSIRR